MTVHTVASHLRGAVSIFGFFCLSYPPCSQEQFRWILTSMSQQQWMISTVTAQLLRFNPSLLSHQCWPRPQPQPWILSNQGTVLIYPNKHHDLFSTGDIHVLLHIAAVCLQSLFLEASYLYYPTVGWCKCMLFMTYFLVWISTELPLEQPVFSVFLNLSSTVLTELPLY
jgi:hypothetical protein